MVTATVTNFQCLDFVDTPVFVVAATSGDGYRLIYVNAAHEANTGLSAQSVCGRLVSEIFPARQASLMRRNYDAAFAQNSPLRYREVIGMAGGDHWYETTLRPMPGADERALCLMGTSVDVTHQRSQAIRDKVAWAEFERFVGMAAHDLRTPMRNVGELAELLRKDFGDMNDGKAELVDMLVEIGQRGSEMVEKVLAFVEARELSAPCDIVDLEKLAQQLLSVADLSDCHQLTVMPALLKTDPLVLQIILHNLIDNSLKHGGRPDLHLKIEVMDDGPGHFHLWFSDNGRGFEGRDVLLSRPGTDHRLFGYGLATIQRLIRSRGGNISVMQSAFGAGAGLAMNLPGEVRLNG